MKTNNVKSLLKKFLALVLAVSMLLPQTIVFASNEDSSLIELSDEEIQNLYQEVTNTRQSVHDPSIVVYDNDGTKEYYVFGSHMGVAKSEDLANWESTSISEQNLANAYFGVRDDEGNVTAVPYTEAFLSGGYGEMAVTTANGSEVTVDFSTFSASEWNTTWGSVNGDGTITDWTVYGNMWAPDVIYNENMDKWCMYMCLNGVTWNSVIILLTADDIEGPYVYEAPIIYSGFSSYEANYYGNTDVNLVLNNGAVGGLPERYDNLIFTTDGMTAFGSWGDYWPHAIDPCVYTDDEGNMWMCYGSWSGGIWTIQLDENTGLRDYSVTYPYEINGVVDESETLSQQVTSDPYFGTKIAGGCYVSGEGAYVEKIGDYYYLFVTYGFLSPTGGYNMRVFRSENPDGPFTSPMETDAIYTSWEDNFRNPSRGLQLMGNYQWNSMDNAEVAQGHNSVLVDDDGNAYLIYHTKFDDGTYTHEVRVHQLYQTEDGWLVAAPYEYAGESANNIASESIPAETIIGTYDLIMHKYNNPTAEDEGTVSDNLAVATPVTITLNEDGTISGDEAGMWQQIEGTSYVVMLLGGLEYAGVFTKQQIDGTDIETLCFSVASDTGRSAWGSKEVSDEVVVAYNSLNGLNIPSVIAGDLNLDETVFQNAVIEWYSSNEEVIDTEGNVTRLKEDTEVVLTKRITKGEYYYDKEYTITVVGTESENADVLMQYDNVYSGDTIMPVDSVNSYTGVSLTFNTEGVTSDWTPIFKTVDGEMIYLAVLNYNDEHIFEAAGTMSEVAASEYAEAWRIFLDGDSQKVTISYNVDGSIDFYKDDVLMLSYGADMLLGNEAVADLSVTMANAVADGILTACYDMTELTIGYALDYKPDVTNMGEPGTVTTKVDGKAWLDTGSHVYLSFNAEGYFGQVTTIEINGVVVDVNTWVDQLCVNDITYESNKITLDLYAKNLRDWDSITGKYDVSLLDYSGSVLATETICYNLEGLSDDTIYEEIALTEDNEYSTAYVAVEGNVVSFITIVTYDKLHSDGVQVGDTNYSWYNGVNSEIYMTINGLKYSVGAHPYLGLYANAVGWGTGTANGSFENDLITGYGVERSFMLLGTFDDDADSDIGCVIKTSVDVTNAGYTADDIAVFTLSGFIGPNDGVSGAWAAVADDVYYVVEDDEIHKCSKTYVEATCCDDAYTLYTSEDGFEKKICVAGTATGKDNYAIELVDNTIVVSCPACERTGTIVLNCEEAGIVESYVPTIVDGVIALPTGEQMIKEGYALSGWYMAEEMTAVSECNLEDVWNHTLSFNALWKKVAVSEDYYVPEIRDIVINCQGQMVEAGEEVTITVTATESTELDNIDITLFISSASQKIGEDPALLGSYTYKVEMMYQGNGMYTCTLDTTDWEAYEHCITGIYFDYVEDGEVVASYTDDAYVYTCTDNYFIVTSNGEYTTVGEDVEYEIAFMYPFDGWGHDSEWRTVYVDNRATWGEVLGAEQFALDAHEELGEFLGWFDYETGMMLYEDTVCNPFLTYYDDDTSIELVAVYENRYLEVYYYYLSEMSEGSYGSDWSSENIIVSSTLTYGELAAMYELPEAIEGNRFLGWDFGAYESEDVIWKLDTAYIYGLYETYYVYVDVAYLTEDDTYVHLYEYLPVDSGVSVMDAIYHKYGNPDTEGYTFKTWRISGEAEGATIEAYYHGDYRVRAQYEEGMLVTYEYSYIEENGENGKNGIYDYCHGAMVIDQSIAASPEELCEYIYNNVKVEHYSALTPIGADCGYYRSYKDDGLIDYISLNAVYDNVILQLINNEDGDSYNIAYAVEPGETIELLTESALGNRLLWCKDRELYYGSYVVPETVKNGERIYLYALVNDGINAPHEVSSTVVGTAWLDSASKITVTFKCENTFKHSQNIYINGDYVQEGDTIGLVTVDKITQTDTEVVVELTSSSIKGWDSIVGTYEVTLRDSWYNYVISETEFAYKLDGLSENTVFEKVQTVEESDTVNAYVAVNGTEVYFITILKSDKIHCDSVTAGGVTYEWWNGFNSEMYMTVDGVTYSVGSHPYYGIWANGVVWSQNSSLIIGANAERGFMALGTFDNDDDTDIGCVLWTKVDLKDAVPESNAVGAFTLSGFIGPNDGQGNFLVVSEDHTYNQNVVFEITSQPVNQEVKENGYATFVVEAEGEGLSYQWQCCKDGSYWFDSSMAGSNTASLQVQALASRDGYQYRCVITDANGTKIISEAATLAIDTYVFEIVSQPKNQSIDENAYTTFEVEAVGAGLTYQWQFCRDGVYWSNSSMAGSNTASMQVQALASRDGYQYRCVITDANGTMLISEAATLTVNTYAFEITSQPESQTIARDAYTTFEVEAVGEGLTYQWQCCKDGSYWFNSGMTGSNTASMQVQALASRDGYQYRCVITDANGTMLISEAATLTVNTYVFEIISQPESQTIAKDAYTTFEVEAVGEGLTYQWQCCKDGSYWFNSGMTGSNTASMQVQALGSRDGYQYRCVITDANGTTMVSEAATLTVKAYVLEITSQPESQTIAKDAYTTFEVEAIGEGLTYQWQCCKDGSYWFNSGMTGSNTASMQVQALASRDGYQYRCVITDANGTTIVSEAATLMVSAYVFEITNQPESQIIAKGAYTTFEVEAIGEGLTYQWQCCKDGSYWFNSGMAGFNTASLQVQALESRDGYQYRCIVTDAEGNQLTTEAATLTIK